MCPPVNDHGLEVLKKSGEEVTTNDKSDYFLKVAGTTSSNASPVSTTFAAGSKVEITDGTDDLAVNANGSINVEFPATALLTTKDFGLSVAEGNQSLYSFINKFGNNTDVDTANEEDIWSVGGTWTPATTAATASVASSSANDTSAGTGARTIRIFGLDASYDEQQEDLTMNGTSTVTTTGTYIRVFRMVVLTAGNSGENEGDIDLTIGGDIQARVPTGKNRTLQAIYTVPNERRGFLTQIIATLAKKPSATGNKEGTIDVLVRPDGGVFEHELVFAINNQAGPINLAWSSPDPIAAKSDIVFRFHAHNNNCNINVGFTLLLEDIS